MRINMRFRTILPVLFLAISEMCMAQADTLSLKHCIELGLENNLSLLQKKEDIHICSIEQSENRHKLIPKIQGFGNFTYNAVPATSLSDGAISASCWGKIYHIWWDAAWSSRPPEVFSFQCHCTIRLFIQAFRLPTRWKKSLRHRNLLYKIRQLNQCSWRNHHNFGKESYRLSDIPNFSHCSIGKLFFMVCR